MSEERFRCRCPSHVFSKASVCLPPFFLVPPRASKMWVTFDSPLLPLRCSSLSTAPCLTGDGGVSVFLGAPRLSSRTSDYFKPIPRQRRANEAGEAFEAALPGGLDGSVGALPVAISDRSASRTLSAITVNLCLIKRRRSALKTRCLCYGSRPKGSVCKRLGCSTRASTTRRPSCRLMLAWFGFVF